MRLFIRAGMSDTHLHKLLCAFAVAHEELGHLGTQRRKLSLKGAHQIRVRLLGPPLVRHRSIVGRRLAVRQRHDCIIRAHIAVNADAVERYAHRFIQAPLQVWRSDRGIRGEEAQHRRMQR